MRLIDADALMPNAELKGVNCIVTAYDIAKAPTVDAVPVVRCKDCLFNDGDGPNEDDKYWCALHQSFMQYCSEAERKEE